MRNGISDREIILRPPPPESFPMSKPSRDRSAAVSPLLECSLWPVDEPAIGPLSLAGYSWIMEIPESGRESAAHELSRDGCRECVALRS